MTVPAGTERVRELAERATHAERLVRDDPGAAAAEAEVILALARAEAVTDAAVARAHYVLAQVAAGSGELPAALRLIELAQHEFEAAGHVADAVRTNLGRIHVLNEMGRHGEAIAAGEAVLAAIPQLLDAHPAAAAIAAAAHQNLGLCYELTGRAADALAAYAAAEARYREIGDDEGVGEVAYDRGLVLLGLGRIAEALAAVDTAIDVFRTAELRAHLAAALTSAGEGHLQLGEFSRALERLQAAGRELAAIDAPWRDHTHLLALARTYLALNCFPEALDAYEAAERWLADSGMATDRARATWGLALARAGVRDFDGARRALEDAASAFAFSGHTQSLASVLCERSAIEAERGEPVLARRLADDALRAALDASAGAEVVRAHLRRAELSDDPDVALAELQAAAAVVDELGLAPLEIAVWQALGRADLRRGRIAAARAGFERAVERIETVRATIAHEALLGNFLHDKAAAYEGLVRCELETPGADRGTRVLAASERARSRTLRELVDGQISRPATMASAADAHLAGELAAVHLELMDPASPERRRELRERSQLLERRIARQRLDRLDAERRRAPDPAVATAGTTPDAVVSYHCFDDTIAVVVADPPA